MFCRPMYKDSMIMSWIFVTNVMVSLAFAAILALAGSVMVLFLDGNSEIAPHVWNNLSYLIFSWHLFRSTGVTNLIFFQKRPIILHTGGTFSELPYCISIMGTLHLSDCVVFFLVGHFSNLVEIRSLLV